jgi:hypothetical protein
MDRWYSPTTIEFFYPMTTGIPTTMLIPTITNSPDRSGNIGGRAPRVFTVIITDEEGQAPTEKQGG